MAKDRLGSTHWLLTDVHGRGLRMSRSHLTWDYIRTLCGVRIPSDAWCQTDWHDHAESLCTKCGRSVLPEPGLRTR